MQIKRIASTNKNYPIINGYCLRGQDLNFAARPNKIAPYYLYQSITATRLTRKHPEHTLHPSTQFDPDPATSPSNPDRRSKAHDPRLKVRGPRLLSRLLSKIGRWLTGADQLRY